MCNSAEISCGFRCGQPPGSMGRSWSMRDCMAMCEPWRGCRCCRPWRFRPWWRIGSREAIRACGKRVFGSFGAGSFRAIYLPPAALLSALREVPTLVKEITGWIWLIQRLRLGITALDFGGVHDQKPGDPYRRVGCCLAWGECARTHNGEP